MHSNIVNVTHTAIEPSDGDMQDSEEKTMKTTNRESEIDRYRTFRYLKTPRISSVLRAGSMIVSNGNPMTTNP